MLKQVLKKNILLAASILGRHKWPLLKGQLLIIGYHRILPRSHPEYKKMQPGMRVEPETLEMHIKTLKKNFEIVDLNDWVKRVKKGQTVPKKACALTFDDGWIDNYEYAFPILKKQNALATIFLVSSMIGTSKKFWPERITDILFQLKEKKTMEIGEEQKKWLSDYGISEQQLATLDDGIIDKLINTLKMLSDKKILKMLEIFSLDEKKMESVEGTAHILNLTQIAEMMNSGLISFASHTQQHLRLTKIDAEKDLEYEIIQSKTVLEAMLGNKINGFCYPNGDFNERSLSKAKLVYDYACTTKKGWNTATSELLLLNRILVHNDVSSTPAAFEARISNLL